LGASVREQRVSNRASGKASPQDLRRENAALYGSRLAILRKVTTSSDLTENSFAGSRGSRIVWSAAAVAWLIGFVSNFLVAPTNTGLSVGDSYASFQIGSNFGSVLALVIWSCAALLTAQLASRWCWLTWARALVAYGVPAVVSLYPSAVVSNAVAHAVAVEDGFVYQDWLAQPLMLSGVVTLVAALIGGILHAKRTEITAGKPPL
jgi:hypothetical protein